ncbi:MAG: hypothetical protein EPN22_09820 [Nitrospirae bacterium]|nr:MAG: hypothetical protein EPN22_09820 [Nitrospirota bacterium]
MKFKLDENFGTRTQQLFRAEGHDVETVKDEGLQGCPDNELYQKCCEEKRCLVSLDLDFGDITRFQPHKTSGIVIIRIPQNPSFAVLEQLIRQFLKSLSQMSVENSLWIVEMGRIRVHQPETND